MCVCRGVRFLFVCARAYVYVCVLVCAHVCVCNIYIYRERETESVCVFVLLFFFEQKIFPEPLLPGTLAQQPPPAKGIETKVVKLSAEDNPIILDEVSTV